MITKCYSIDDESFIYNDLSSLFDELESEGNLVEGQIYYEADAKKIEAKDYASEHVIEQILEVLELQLFRDIGEQIDYGYEFSEVNKEATEELASMLEGWINKNVNLDKYWKVVGRSRECWVTKEDL